MKHTKLAAAAAGLACLAGLLAGRRAWEEAAVTPQNSAAPASAAPSTSNYNSVIYTASGTPERMDILPPPVASNSNNPAPVILCIHGGAWSGGDRTEMYRAMTWLQGQGYCTCTIDYRLAPASPFPAQIEDCKCAVRYLRAHAQKLHIDPNHIGVFGISAGAHLALLLGLTPHVGALEGIGGWNGESSGVQSVLALCGPTDLAHWPGYAHAAPEVHGIMESFLGGPLEQRRALAVEASPVSYVHAESGRAAPPILLLHGDRDTLVPLSQSEELYSRLKAAGGDVTLRVAGGVGHGSYDVFITPDNVALTQDFYSRTLRSAK